VDTNLIPKGRTAMMNIKAARLMGIAGVAGFGVGWLVFGSAPGDRSPAITPKLEPTAAHSPIPEPELPRREFTLRPADVSADRETPAVAVDSKGRALLAWASQTGDLERVLTLARSTDGGRTFSEPVDWRKVPIYRYGSKSKGKEVSYSTHVLPRLVASGDSIHLGWVEAINGGPKVIYYVATSVDGGQTFSEPVPTHGPDASKPGFTALAVGLDGSILTGWLDNQRPYSSALLTPSAGFEPERLAYESPDGKGVCPCCDVAVAQGADGGRFVAFRNAESGNRDIMIAGPNGPVAVGSDHWKHDGCPHDGPSLALSASQLDVVWMDAHSGKGRVYHASSATEALTFKPRELAPGSPGVQGHPKLARLADGRLVAAWDESIGEPPAPAEAGHGHSQGHAPAMTGGGRAIQLAVSTGDGFGSPVMVAPKPGAFQLQPAIAPAGDGSAVVAWVELDESGKKIVVRRVELAQGAIR
jgi:hypothetical protein